MLSKDSLYSLFGSTPAALLAAGVFIFSPAPIEPLVQDVMNQHSRVIERRFELPEGGLFQLTNVSGNIMVEGVSGRIVYVHAEKTVRAPNRVQAEELLEALSISVIEEDSTVEVRTLHPAADELNSITGSESYPSRLSVTYNIKIPVGVRINLRSTSGNITVSGIVGGLDLKTVSGHLKLGDIGGQVELGSVSGDITIEGSTGSGLYGEPAGSDFKTGEGARIRATSVSGAISILSGEWDEVAAMNTGGDIRWEGLVKPECSYMLSSHSGNIEFVATGGIGFEVSLSTLSGSISAPLELTLKGERISRRSLSGEYLEPKALVVLTAFSGDITLMVKP